MTMAIVQHKSEVRPNQVPGATPAVLTSTPTVGNIILAYIGTNISRTSLTINTAKWTVVDIAYDTRFSVIRGLVLARIVESGDTTSLPAFCTAGSTYWTYCVYEVSGQAGTTVEEAVLTSMTRSFVAYTPSPFPNLPMLKDDNIAFAFFAAYNGASNPSIYGTGWTLDEAANNASNFGSLGSGHRPLGVAEVLDGEWIPNTTQEPQASALVVLRSDDTQGFYPRHTFSYAIGTGTASSVTVPWTPQVGNLLVAYLDWDQGSSSSPPTISSSWTEWASAGNTNSQVKALYRYVQSGDTSALPALTTAGSDYKVVTVMEFESPTAAFADKLSDQTGFQATGLTMATTADTTTTDAELALAHIANYNNNNTVSEDGDWFVWNNYTDHGPYGSYSTVMRFYPVSGETVEASFSGLSANPSAYIQTLFQLPTVPPATHTDAYRANLIDGGGTNSGVDVTPRTVYSWQGQIFTKNSVGSPLTRSDFNGMSVQVERTN